MTFLDGVCDLGLAGLPSRLLFRGSQVSLYLDLFRTPHDNINCTPTFLVYEL